MSTNKPKPTSKPGPEAPAEPSAKKAASGEKSTGRVKFDDKGNAVWEWQVATGAYSLEVSTQRLQKLQNPSLEIADDAPNTFDRVRPNPLGNKKGYDPYDSGKLGKPSKPQQKDLRKLGDWLKLKKQADSNKDKEPKG